MIKQNTKNGFAIVAVIVAVLIPILLMIGLVIYTIRQGPQEETTATSQKRN